MADEKRVAKLFDVRRVIGLLFVVYGVIVTLLGLFDNEEEIAKAQDIRINVWMGLAMLALGGFFLAWQWLRPPVAPTPEELAEQGDRPPSH
jgi:drug/metabolite transporter (DMT)-like permease